MIPTISSTLIQGVYLSPDGRIGSSPLVDYELGGRAIQDPSLGLQYQIWYGYWDPSDDIGYLTPTQTTNIPIATIIESDVREFSFCFDQSMRWHVAIVTNSDQLKFYWYDPTIPGYTTTTWNGVKSAKLTLDDKRPKEISAGISDVLLSYIKSDDTLNLRAQRERYETEHLLSSTLESKLRITNFGMTDKLRLQWRFQRRTW